MCSIELLLRRQRGKSSLPVHLPTCPSSCVPSGDELSTEWVGGLWRSGAAGQPFGQGFSSPCPFCGGSWDCPCMALCGFGGVQEGWEPFSSPGRQQSVEKTWTLFFLLFPEFSVVWRKTFHLNSFLICQIPYVIELRQRIAIAVNNWTHMLDKSCSCVCVNMNI